MISFISVFVSFIDLYFYLFHISYFIHCIPVPFITLFPWPFNIYYSIFTWFLLHCYLHTINNNVFCLLFFMLSLLPFSLFYTFTPLPYPVVYLPKCLSMLLRTVFKSINRQGNKKRIPFDRFPFLSLLMNNLVCISFVLILNHLIPSNYLLICFLHVCPSLFHCYR